MINFRQNKLKEIIFKILMIFSIFLMFYLLLLNSSIYAAEVTQDNLINQNENSSVNNTVQSTDMTSVSNSLNDDKYTSATVESIKTGLSDESLSFTNLLIIVLISLNIVLLILALVILMQVNKKM